MINTHVQDRNKLKTVRRRSSVHHPARHPLQRRCFFNSLVVKHNLTEDQENIWNRFAMRVDQ